MVLEMSRWGRLVW
jgi:hypothetical protein